MVPRCSLIPVPDLKATNSFSRISDSGDLLRISSRLIQIWYNITVTGLSGPITGAHFHGPAGEEENAGVIFPFITEPFDGEHVEGIWPDLTDEALEYLLHEGVYVNVHTTANPPGEIRGQVVGLELPLEGEEENFFTIDLDPGLNMISLPLRPPEPYTARTLAEQLDATVVIKLDSARQQFVGFTPDTDSDGFPIEGGKGYIVNVPDGGTATFTGRAWTNNAPPGVPVVNLRTTAWAFVVSGDLHETEVGSTYTVVAENLRTGEVATDLVSSDRTDFAAVWADLSRKSVVEAGDKLEITMVDDRGNIVSGPFQRHVDIDDIRKAFLSIPLIFGDVRPTETLLAQNFPNPFNPETWIPYQIAESAEVTIQIYDPAGRLVRTIDLGFQPRGFYTTRDKAVYWDGRNSVGERVASGVYFYTLQTENYTAARKMLIAK